MPELPPGCRIDKPNAIERFFGARPQLVCERLPRRSPRFKEGTVGLGPPVTPGATGITRRLPGGGQETFFVDPVSGARLPQRSVFPFQPGPGTGPGPAAGGPPSWACNLIGKSSCTWVELIGEGIATGVGIIAGGGGTGGADPGTGGGTPGSGFTGCPAGSVGVPPFCIDLEPDGDVSGGGMLLTQGEPVNGRYGAALVPNAESRTVLSCPKGHVLGDDELCYDRRALRKQNRKWPPGRRPLLTGGDLNAISRAARAASRVKTQQKRLEKLGLLKRPKRGFGRGSRGVITKSEAARALRS